MKRFALLLALCAGTLAQTGLQKFVLNKISSSGSKRFTEADIIAATGLKTGATITADDLKRAADRLAQSGAFSQVNYRFSGDAAQFELVDVTQFLPVTFENFIWFSDADLLQRVHSTVPLFNGSLPPAGNLPDQVSAALNSVLKEKGIQGHAAPMMQGKLGGPLQTLQYQIEGVSVKISEVRFPGATPERIQTLQKIIKEIAGDTYMRSLFTDMVRQNGLQVYSRMGLLKVQFGTAKITMVKDDPAQPLVAVEVPVQEGDQYLFAGANWNGATVFSASDLSKTIDLKPGAPADTTQLATCIQKAKELYGTKGYLYVQVKSTAALDNEKHTALFNLDVNEGPVYHMGKLQIEAPDESRTALVRRYWDLHEGDVYDASYVRGFMRKHPVELSPLAGWSPHYTQTIHDDTHVVDLSIKFVKFQREAK